MIPPVRGSALSAEVAASAGGYDHQTASQGVVCVHIVDFVNRERNIEGRWALVKAVSEAKGNGVPKTIPAEPIASGWFNPR